MAVDDNFLSRFSAVVQSQGEEREAQAQETIKNLENELGGYEHRVKLFRPQVLLDKLESPGRQMGCSDPRIGDLWREICLLTRAEVYRRLVMLEALGK